MSAAPARRVRVGVLGATGAVGQRFVQLLEAHALFEVVALGASSRSAGRRYDAAARWGVGADMPAYARALVVTACAPAAMPGVELVFSALDADVAGDVEAAFRDAGVAVFSNARNHRMVADVPLVVPPVNGGHLELVRAQAAYARCGGFIVTNANCSTTGLVIALKPIHDAFGIVHATVATMQAISGAGYPVRSVCCATSKLRRKRARTPRRPPHSSLSLSPSQGLPSLDILDNVVPFISGEEEKLESEYRKILGALSASGGAVEPAAFPLTAMVHRVHVRDGHCIAVSLQLRDPAASAEAVAAVLRGWAPADAALRDAPSAPAAFITVRDEADRPQPYLDRDAGRGFTTVVGRVRACALNSVKLFIVSHNTVMGAAGSSILNAELAHAKGLLRRRAGEPEPAAPPATGAAAVTAP